MGKEMVDGFPRRSRLDLHTPAEAAIRAALVEVEAAGAHQLLTDAVNLLIAAGDKVADFVELDAAKRRYHEKGDDMAARAENGEGQ